MVWTSLKFGFKFGLKYVILEAKLAFKLTVKLKFLLRCGRTIRSKQGKIPIPFQWFFCKNSEKLSWKMEKLSKNSKNWEFTLFIVGTMTSLRLYDVIVYLIRISKTEPKIANFKITRIHVFFFIRNLLKISSLQFLKKSAFFSIKVS